MIKTNELHKLIYIKHHIARINQIQCYEAPLNIPVFQTQETLFLSLLIDPVCHPVNRPCPPATGKYLTTGSVPQLGEPETFIFQKRPVMDTRCSVQFETFQYNLVLW